MPLLNASSQLTVELSPAPRASRGPVPSITISPDSRAWVDGATSCQACGEGEVASTDSKSCQCAAGRYNATNGQLACFAFDYDGAAYPTAAQRVAAGGLLRLPCPEEPYGKRRHMGTTGQPSARENYGVSEPYSNVTLTATLGKRALYRCPVDGACRGDVGGVVAPCVQQVTLGRSARVARTITCRPRRCRSAKSVPTISPETILSSCCRWHWSPTAPRRRARSLCRPCG